MSMKTLRSLSIRDIWLSSLLELEEVFVWGHFIGIIDYIALMVNLHKFTTLPCKILLFQFLREGGPYRSVNISGVTTRTKGNLQSYVVVFKPCYNDEFAPLGVNNTFLPV